jgi:hypothetical protein
MFGPGFIMHGIMCEKKYEKQTQVIGGKKITQKGLKTPIIDFGMIRNIHKSKIYSFLNGLS